MEDFHIFHLHNERLEGLESFVLVLFNAHINIAFCFDIHGSLQVVSCDP